MKLLTYAEHLSSRESFFARSNQVKAPMRYLSWLGLFLFAFFHHISSSEFWPITISKSWLIPGQFEDSVLQKPLLSLFLALFHLLPLGDTSHIYLVKAVFALLGVAALTIFSLFLIEFSRLTPKRLSRIDLAALLAVLLFALSPVVRNNFFNIRSDQIAFLLFSIFLLFCEKEHLRAALVALLLIPCFGIKEIIFLLPGAIYFYLTFKQRFKASFVYFGALSSLAVLVWVIALNTDSAYYLFQTYLHADYSLRFGARGIFPEAAPIFLSLLSIVFIIYHKLQKFYKLCALSAIFSSYLLALPQANSFFIASVLPLVYLPFFAILLEQRGRPLLQISGLALPVIWSITFIFSNHLPWYQSNIQQLKFIKTASKTIETYNFNYLDGEGILPRKNFVRCFVSPEDDNSNNSCRQRLHYEKPDVIIITNRLIYLGDEVFRLAEKNYEQIYPNFWVIREKVTDKLRAKADLSNKNPLPIVIF